MPKINEWPEWPNARDWVGIASLLLTIGLLVMMWVDHDLLKDDFFKTIATLIIGTGWINSVVSWAYGSTKSGSEIAERNSLTVEKQLDTTSEEKKK